MSRTTCLIDASLTFVISYTMLFGRAPFEAATVKDVYAWMVGSLFNSLNCADTAKSNDVNTSFLMGPANQHVHS